MRHKWLNRTILQQMKSSAVALLTLLLVAPIGHIAFAATTTPDNKPRQTISLNDGWHFQFGGDNVGVQNADFNDNAWEKVTVPHTWNRVGEYSLTRSASTNNKQGIGWYRLKFSAPVAARGQHQYLDFAAVSNIAEVWVNGVRVGEHRGAFSRFRFDVSTMWKPGQANLIVVRADNTKPAAGSSTSEILPLTGDFFIYGGIYRTVSLISIDAASIDLLDHGGSGVYAHAENITGKTATVIVNTRLRNQGNAVRALTAFTTITDAQGKRMASATLPAKLAANNAQETMQKINIANPQLWDGRANPYLYHVNVELRDGKRVIDSVTQPLGIRTFKFDANDGFFLNGKYLALHGVSRHQDRAGKGWAQSRADHAEDMALIAEMGANTVRMAHYQHDDAWADEADSHGMVAWAEVPYVSASAYDGSEGAAATFDNARQQTVELIRQNYNHPSIMMWSVGNEVDATAIFLANGKSPKSLKLLQEINRIAKQEDPTRATVFADCCEDSKAFGGIKITEKLAGTADLIGYNRYFGWYYDQPGAMGPALDAFHLKHPALPMSVSEYGAGGALSQHSDNPLGGLISSFGRPHPEEYQSWYHEENWKQLNARKYVFASWIWNMFDFASDLREEGEAIDLNDKGLVSFDRKVKKDAFYFYQANWSTSPVLHITGKRYADRAYPVVDVRAYSNANNVELMVNDVAIGSAACPNRICVWPNVRLKTGANIVKVRANIGGQAVTDSANLNAPEIERGIRIDAGSLAGRVAANGERFGSDNFFIGGTPKLLNESVFKFLPQPTQKIVDDATEPRLFDAWREGDFSYAIPLPNGNWTVTVYSFEPDVEMGDKRSFSISANGNPVVSGFRPAEAAGGTLKAVTKSFPVTVTGGLLNLGFKGESAAAVVSAITVTH